MFGLYRIKQSLEWKIPNQDDWQYIYTSIYSKYERLHTDVTELFGPGGWIVLGLFAFFLLLILSIYIKSIIDAFKEAPTLETDADSTEEGLFYTIDNNPVQTVANDNDENINTLEINSNQRSTYDDLERELSLSLLKASHEDINDHDKEVISSNIKEKMRLHAEVENAKRKELNKITDQTLKTEELAIEDNQGSIIALIINLLGRGVSVSKINQALYFHYKNKYEMHEIIHIVQSVCNFIGLCNAGKFDYLPQRQMLPETDAAIYAWAQGDSSLALILLQSFLNQLMEQAQEESGIIKDMTYALAANCSCIMGDIAKLSDTDLAHNSFELATELSPKNVTAWNSLGDIYVLRGATEKAMIAYQNVIDIADKYLYASEIAHAQQQLASYYQKQELFSKANQLNDLSKEYYEATGISTNLTEKEIIAYNTVYNSSKQNLRNHIHDLLNTYNF